MRTGHKLWLGGTTGLALAQVAACALAPRGFALGVFSDILSATLMFALVLAFAMNAGRSQGRLLVFWILQSASWAFLLIDQICWMVYDILLRKPIPAMFAGDVLLFLPGALMLAGLLLRPHLQPSKRSARLGMLDFLLLMLWCTYFYVALVVCWQYVSANDALYNRNFDRLYVAEFVVVVTVLVLMLRGSAGKWRRFYGYFLGAVGFYCLTFLLENRAIELNTYFSGSWYDAAYASAFPVFVAVAITGRGLKPTPEAAADESYGSWMAGFALVAVLSLPVIAIWVVLEQGVALDVVRFRGLVTAVTMFLMAGLLFIKMRRLNEDLKQVNKVLEEASMTDPLTGIRNRRFFSATIEGDAAQAMRGYARGREATNRDLVFYLIDMDNFKEVNDLHGHDAGDRVLVETVRRIGSAIRDSDVLVRWGGEEFLVVSRFTNRKDADALALRVMEAVRGLPFTIDPECEMRRTCSIGWAAFPWLQGDHTEMGYEGVLKLADRALSYAKNAGKDQVIGVTPQGEDAGVPKAGTIRHLRPAEL